MHRAVTTNLTDFLIFLFRLFFAYALAGARSPSHLVHTAQCNRLPVLHHIRCVGILRRFILNITGANAVDILIDYRAASADQFDGISEMIAVMGV